MINLKISWSKLSTDNWNLLVKANNTAYFVNLFDVKPIFEAHAIQFFPCTKRQSWTPRQKAGWLGSGTTLFKIFVSSNLFQ
jgi:hypothetical protein